MFLKNTKYACIYTLKKKKKVKICTYFTFFTYIYRYTQKYKNDDQINTYSYKSVVSILIENNAI